MCSAFLALDRGARACLKADSSHLRKICGLAHAPDACVLPSSGPRSPSERCPRSVGLAVRPWRFRSASSTFVSGMALSVLHVGCNSSLHLFWHVEFNLLMIFFAWHIESRFANVLFCALRSSGIKGVQTCGIAPGSNECHKSQPLFVLCFSSLALSTKPTRITYRTTGATARSLEGPVHFHFPCL